MDATKPPLPLEGIRVLDATHVVAGPYCSMLLGDAGAEVIKVERPGTGERGRKTPPILKDTSGQEVSARYLMVNRNKKSITLDLRQPRGQKIFGDMVGICDILLDNWGPGAMKRLGVDYDWMKSINPSIIYATISGYGDSEEMRGPYSNWSSNNPCAQGMGGWMEITGSPDGPPQMVGDNIGDSVPAVWSAFAIMLALEWRRKTGLGQHVDMAMYDCMVAHNTSTVPTYQLTGKPSGRELEHMTSAQLTLKAKDGYVVLAGAGEPERWMGLWRMAGRHDLMDDPRFLGQEATGPFFTGVVQPEIEAWSCNIPKLELAESLLGLGFSAAMVQNIEDMVHCPQLNARNMWTQIDHPIAGNFTIISNPIKMSGPGPFPAGTPPLVGEHNEEILGGLLGISDHELADMKTHGVI